jgi:hypothetical protein
MPMINLCIPRVEIGISNEYIKKKMESHVGTIHRIIEIPHKNNPHYKRVIMNVFLKPNTEKTSYIQERFSQRQDIKVIHQTPWFWKIVEASAKPVQ